MSRRPRRNHKPCFKEKVALAAFTCDGYDSVWRVDNVQVRESGLVDFDFVDQLAWCY